MKQFLLLFCFFASIAANAQAPIVGGNYVNHGDYPWMVSLEVQGAPICGAALIAPDWVITAGHCAFGSPPFIPQPDKVVINLYSRNFVNIDAESIEIDTIFIHKSFDMFNFEGPDIALIKLKQPSTKTPLALASATDTILYSTNAKCKVLGWGSTDFMGTQSDTLKEADVKVINYDSCHTKYAATGWILKNYQVCVGYEKDSTESGAGAGDSGGPLFAWHNNQWVHIGIVSGGNEIITTVDYPGIFTRTALMRNWIDSVMTANTIFAGTPVITAGDFNLYIKNGRMEISTTSDEMIMDVQINNILGQKVVAFSASGNATSTDISDFASGIYVATVKTEKGIRSKKFYKQ